MSKKLELRVLQPDEKMLTAKDFKMIPNSAFSKCADPMVQDDYGSLNQPIYSAASKKHKTIKKIKGKTGGRNKMKVDYDNDYEEDDEYENETDSSTESDSDYFTPLKNVASTSKIKFKVNTKKYKIKATNVTKKKQSPLKYSAIEGIETGGSYHVAKKADNRFVFRNVYLNC